MAVNNFKLYDIIVDIIPGAIMSIILVTFFTPSGTLQSLLTGKTSILHSIILVGVFYVVGRLTHEFSSLIIDFFIWIKSLIYRVYVYILAALIPIEGKWMSWLSNRISSIKSYVTSVINFLFIDVLTFEDRVYDSIKPMRNRNISALEDKWIENLIEEMSIETNVDLQQEWGINDGSEDSLEYMCHSFLFDKSTLYHRYEVLSTFFRSMLVITMFAISLVLYSLFYNWKIYQNESTAWSEILQNYPNAVFLTLYTSPFAFIIFIRQYRKFTNRKERTLINDTLLRL